MLAFMTAHHHPEPLLGHSQRLPRSDVEHEMAEKGPGRRPRGIRHLESPSSVANKIGLWDEIEMSAPDVAAVKMDSRLVKPTEGMVG